MTINGDFDSTSANLLLLRLEKCRESPTLKCKSEEEITEYFRNKWLLLFYNERQFDANHYGYESIVKTSRLKWHSVNT